MSPRIVLSTLVFTVSLTGFGHQAVAEPTPPAPSDIAQATADNKPGFLGVAVAESIAPPDAGLDAPQAVLVVSDVMPGSAADEAGLRSGDVLLKIGGQHLLHPVQLSRLVSMHPAGQNIELIVLRDGEKITVPATLAERPDALAPKRLDVPGVAPALRPDDLDWPDPQRGPAPRDLELMQQRMDRQFEEMRQKLRQGMDQGWPGGEMWERIDPIELDLNFNARPGGQRVTVLQDNEHKITVTQSSDGRHLLATDLQGHVLFDGPINTADQLNTVPGELRTKLPEPGELNLGGLPQLGPIDLFERLNPPPHQPTEDSEAGERLPAPAGRAV